MAHRVSVERRNHVRIDVQDILATLDCRNIQAPGRVGNDEREERGDTASVDLALRESVIAAKPNSSYVAT